MGDNNNPKTVPEGQTGNKAVTKPVNAPMSLNEAQAAIEAEEGEIEEKIEEQKLKDDTEIADDLKDLKKKQKEKKVEVKKEKVEEEAKDEPKDEVKHEVKDEVEEETKETIVPSKLIGKTEEEKLKIYQEMEKSFTKVSQEKKDIEKKLSEASEANKKIEEYEKAAVVRQQKKTTVKLPPYPDKKVFYEDPDKYFEEIKVYNDAKLNATVAPLYGQNMNYQRQTVINKLKDKTVKDLVPYKDVESEVEFRLKKNPALVNQYGLAAREVVYNQLKNEKAPQKVEDIEKMALEKAKNELKEESVEMKNNEIMTSDITTTRREGKAVDFTEILDKEDNPQKVIDGLKKKYGIDSPL